MNTPNITKDLLQKIQEGIYQIPTTYRSDMRVPAQVFVSESMLEDILQDRSLEQLVNVSTLPGIVQAALAMPDIHQGYGFPIGGVAALTFDQGVISPGGIGYDINCGVRLLAASISAQEIKKYLPALADALFKAVPSGVGRGGTIKLSRTELDKILVDGAHHMLSMGYGIDSDLEYCEERGSMAQADPTTVSDKAKERGFDQLGTLGSGNHFLEIQEVQDIFDTEAAGIFGLKKNMITIMIHCGSRGVGHQTCTDYVRRMIPKLDQWGIVLPDKELACAPLTSIEGSEYFSAMAASANFAWANRHVIGHAVRKAFSDILGNSVDVRSVYDLSHNIGKKEMHIVNGNPTPLLVHRKGATRAFGPDRPEVPTAYQSVGHPVLIPGTMGTSSYVLVGTDQETNKAFGSSCHGAGRRMSRMQAKKTIRGTTLRQELEDRGIIIRCESDAGLAEEAPTAYKDVDAVIQVVQNSGLAKPVARLTPLAVIKGG